MSAEQKYTRGPWKLRMSPYVKGCFVEAPKASGMPYALDVCGDDYTGYGDEAQREINMRLIATAPELLEALIAICDASADSSQANFAKAVTQGRAVIVMATGAAK